jgi:hypothetical protein
VPSCFTGDEPQGCQLVPATVWLSETALPARRVAAATARKVLGPRPAVTRAVNRDRASVRERWTVRHR